LHAGLVLGAALVTVLLVSHGIAGAVPVQGTLGLPASLGDAAPVPEQYWELRNGVVPTRPDHLDPRRELTVVLRGDAPAEDPGCQYGFLGGDLMPRTMVVEADSTLRITNNDATEHELYVEALERFTALSTAPGMARSERIPAGGPYELADALYPHVDGRIVVVTGLVACGTIGDRGAYSFENVAPGSYQLEVYPKRSRWSRVVPSPCPSSASAQRPTARPRPRLQRANELPR